MIVRFLSDPTNAADAAKASTQIRELAAACGSPAWLLMQSFKNLTFSHWSGELPHDFADCFAGRIFGASAEIRWIREGSGWRIWHIHEPAEGGSLCRAETVPHYLWGEWDPELKYFREAKAPREMIHPVEAPAEGLPDRARAYINVRLYHSEGPDAWDSEAALEAELNEPYVSAHRFETVAFTTRPKGKEDKDGKR